MSMMFTALEPWVGTWCAACMGFHFAVAWVLPVPMDNVLDEPFMRGAAQDIIGMVGMPFRCVSPLSFITQILCRLMTCLWNTA